MEGFGGSAGERGSAGGGADGGTEGTEGVAFGPGAPPGDAVLIVEASGLK